MYGRNIEKERAKWCEAAKAAGKDEDTMDFSDLHKHKYQWFNIVNDLISIMELAQGWPVPGESNPSTIKTPPAQRK